MAIIDRETGDGKLAPYPSIILTRRTRRTRKLVNGKKFFRVFVLSR